ncbi:hypothetical protein NESM_000275500 [Novymonas esmeraldas]|uniref:Uncharacterized protein n=1 Tax=Novymonas esmeraldas TaxID=1808958 RepID=A0AAW0FDC7_9TRYP
MGWFTKARPTTPIYIPDARRPSYSYIAKSPDVLLSSLLMGACYYVLMYITGDTTFEGPQGLWRTFGRKSRARMQSRDAELLPEPPLALSLDMIAVVLCAVATNCFLSACSRVLMKEQRRIENAAEAERLEAMTLPETRKERLATEAAELAERVKFWAANDERRKAGQAPRRERIKRLDVLADEVMTNIIVTVSVAVSLCAGYSIMTQRPNQVRGLGLAVMLLVLMGAIIACGLDRHLSGMQHYCNFIHSLSLVAVLGLVARASVLAT